MEGKEELGAKLTLLVTVPGL